MHAIILLLAVSASGVFAQSNVAYCATEPNQANVEICVGEGPLVDIEIFKLDDGNYIPGWVVPVHTYEVEDPAGETPKVDCGSDNCYELCFTKICNGTLEFLQYVEDPSSTVDLQQYSEQDGDFEEGCFCDVIFVEEKYKVSVYGIWYDIVERIPILGRVIMDNPEHPSKYNMGSIDVRRREAIDPESTPCQAFPVVLKGQVLVNGIGELESAIWFLELEKDKYMRTVEITSSSASIILPDYVFFKSGTLIMKVYRNGDLCVEKFHQIIGKKPSVTHDCLWCYSTYDDWNRLQPAQKWFIVLSWLLIFALLLFICNLWKPLLFGIAALVVWLVKAPVKFVKSVKNSQMSRDLKSKMANSKEYMFGNEMTPEVKEDMLPKKPVKRSFLPTYGASLTIMFCLFIPLVLAGPIPEPVANCVNGLTIPSQVTDCVEEDPETEICAVSFNALISIPFITGSACLTLVDITNNEFLTEVTVTYENLQQVNTLSKIYYTAPWYTYIFSKDKCDDYKHCKGSFGTEWLAKNDPFYKGIITLGQTFLNGLLNWPGEVYFGRNDGGAYHGCPADPGDKCIYGAASIIPDLNEIHKVMKINAPTLHPSFKVNVTNANFTEIGRITYSGFPLSVLDINIRHEGNLETDRYDHSANGLFKVIQSETGGLYHAIVQAADQNIPGYDVIGDIQSDTISKMSTPKRDAFLFHADLLDAQLVGYAFGLISPGPALNSSTGFDYLPKVGSYGTAFISGGSLRTNLTQSGAALLSLQSSTAFSVVRKSKLVCPVINSVVDASGCYNCDEGVEIVLDAESSCVAGFAMVSVDDSDIHVNTNSVYLLDEPSSVVIFVKTSKTVNVFEICLHHSTYESCIEVDFIAIESQTVYDSSNKTGKMNHHKSGFEKPDSFSGFFGKTLNGIFKSLFQWSGSWWERLVAVLFLLFIIYVFVKVVPVLFVSAKASYVSVKSNIENRMAKPKAL